MSKIFGGGRIGRASWAQWLDLNEATIIWNE